MAAAISSLVPLKLQPLPPLLDDIPILYEDEGEGDMGESNPHVLTEGILRIGIDAHLREIPGFRVFSNLNLIYRNGPPHPRTGALPYVSPDLMVVSPARDLGLDVSSYRIGDDGPAPVLTAEVLSKRSGQQSDLKKKVIVYAKLGVAEYILVDWTGRFLKQRLLLKRLQPDRTWNDEQDADGGVTSKLGFRLIWDADGWLRVLETATGKRYCRPDEAQTAMDRLAAIEEQVRALQEEVARLRGTSTKKPKETKRRKKS